MINEKDACELKAKVKQELWEYLTGEGLTNPLVCAEKRLKTYALDCTRPGTDVANLFELLGLRKALRLALTYPVDKRKLQRVLQCYEGRWQSGQYVEGSGGLLFSGLRGRTHYELTPLQVFELAVPFSIMRASDDQRRLTTEAVYFIPRKSSKTTLAAFFQVWFFFFEDYNCEGYCIANSQEQSKILFRLVSDLIRQLDPKGRHIRFTSTEINWKLGEPRACKIAALTSGGKTKDGLFAGLVCADEYGAAYYVKERSAMANLLQVVEGSMGARREPLTVITTTAGRVNYGPFEAKLDGIKESLLKEAEFPIGAPCKTDDDWQFAVICAPDLWETDDESLQKPEVWRKVNRHIGITVQPDYYANEWAKMLRDDEKRREQITKLFNVFESGRARRWITASQIIKLQGSLPGVDGLRKADGWLAFVGMDFSRGDDLCGLAWLCYSPKLRRFFADTDMWITSKALETSQNATLYRPWAEQGRVHVCPGEVIAETMITDRIAEVAKTLRILRFGYDPYDAKVFVNYLNAWLRTQRVDPAQIVVPVKQTWGNFNSSCQTLERLVAMEAIEFSSNPVLPWCFGNAILEEDRMENVKPVKASPAAKIDPVICILEGLILMEQLGGIFGGEQGQK